jgi:TIR domain
MAHEVFISYCSKDKNIADAVCAGLEAEKIACWIAPRDVPPGANYGAAIIEAIIETQIMVVFFSIRCGRESSH